jgi:hypothetical protein
MRLHGRVSFAVAVMSSVAVMAACGGRDEAVAPPAQSAAMPGPTTLVGCIAQTGQPGVFLLSVAEARDAQVNTPPGTALPRPDGAGITVTQGVNPSDPVPTSGGPGPGTSPPTAGASSKPGAGPTTTTKISTYRLVGGRAGDMAAYVGATMEVTGSIQELPSQAPQDTQQINGEFQVESARPLAKECVR